MGHEYGWFVLVDAAQAIRHERVDVQALDCDFLAFSGHKMMGPTGIGVLYGKRALLDELPPTGFGGEMVEEVRTDCSTFEAAPLRLEPGTPNYVGAIGLSAAIDFLEAVGRDDITQREHELLEQLETGLAALPRVHIEYYGHAAGQDGRGRAIGIAVRPTAFGRGAFPGQGVPFITCILQHVSGS